MIVNEIQIFTLFTMILNVSGKACDTGWFGPGCRYRCHCSLTRDCYHSGNCPHNEPCATRFFGPGCQQINAVTWGASSTLPLYLRDSNDRTCNPNIDATRVDVILVKGIPFSWFRIVSRDRQNMKNFVTIINDMIQCGKERKFIIGNNIVDVTCNNRDVLMKLRIQGDIAPHICSIYINIGRNLALKETTQQSTTFIESIPYYSYKAVDGNFNPGLNHGSCAHTEQERQPWWSINFTFPVVINTLQVFNRGKFQYRLDNFILVMYNTDGKEEKTFIGGRNIYHYQEFDVDTNSPISYIVIKQSTSIEFDERCLTICEFVAFGDYHCPHNRYGLFCEKNCACKFDEICNGITGKCVRACSQGFYGYNCSSRCSRNCMPNTCDYISGYCSGCAAGYTGNTCLTVCLPGTYGPSCKFKCSVGCNDTCNVITGHCICKTEYVGMNCRDIACPQGYNCTERCLCHENEMCEIITGKCTGTCANGYFGNTCSLFCSESCDHMGCEQSSGKCHQCHPGYMGDYCNEECGEGSFGLHCTYNCSKYCDDVCNVMTGNCAPCKKGYKGTQCTECDNFTYGEKCALPCPELCYRNVCRHDTGACITCFGQRIGPKCEDCPDTYYGPMCEEKCSETCFNATCDKVTGHCLVCHGHSSGLHCLQEHPPTSSYTGQLWFYTFLSVFASMFVIAIIMISCLPRTERPQFADIVIDGYLAQKFTHETEV